MSFPKYQAYKASGIAWLGNVPATWSVLPLKAVATCNDEVLPEGTDGDAAIKYVEISGVEEGRGITQTESLTFAAAPSRARRVVRHGDVLISTVRTYLRAIATVSHPPENLVASTGFAAIRPRSAHPGFLGYLLHCEYLIAEVIARSVGISYPAINASDLMRLKGPIPGREEQAAIATFLDREAAKIDALVEEQRRLIDLLKEKRQAVISQAVTKGLNANVQMKDSGVEWLGKVPAHWEVVPLKWLTQPDRPIMYGIVLPGPDVGVGVPILKGGNVRPSRLRLDALARTTPEIEAPYARARLRQGDLVYSIRGTIGDCELVPVELDGCNITQDVARIAPAEEIDADWLRFALLSDAVAEDLACGSLGAAVRGINIYDLKRAMLPVPPKIERTEIARAINAAVKEFETLMEAADLAMMLLRERRSALITAAVTGKIDVRGVVPQLEAVAA